nr:MAG TPA: hypothetical protein [Caudoviricetes sp.]
MLNKNIRPETLATYIKTQEDNMRIDTFRFADMNDALITDVLPQYIDVKDVELTETEINKYTHSPKLLSYDVYKTTDLWFIICIVNSCKRAYEFKPDKIIKLPTDDGINAMIYAFNNLRKV